MFDVLLVAGSGGPPLHRTLRSIGSSTVTPSRLVCVCDGWTPTHDDRAVFDALPCETVLDVLPERGGLTRALKRGEDAISSPLVARIDVGDEAAPERFARQVDRMIADDGLAAVGVRTALVFDGRGTQRLSRIVPDARVAETLARFNPFVHGSLMIRTERLRAVGGYDVTFPSSQDYDLLLRLSRVGRLAILPEVLHTHTFHDGGSTLARPRRQLLMSCRAKARHLRAGYRPTPAFLAYWLRDAVLSLLPSGALAALKARSFESW